MGCVRPGQQRIRVLTVIDGLGFAGGESRILSMGQALDRERFEHSVLTLNPLVFSTRTEFEARRGHYRAAGVRTDDLSEVAPERDRSWPGIAGRIYGKTGVLRRARRLARMLRAWRVDVIDSHLDSAGVVSVLAVRMAGVPVASTLYCGDWSGADTMTWHWTTRALVRWADVVLTDSRIRSQQMQRLAPGQPEKFQVIPNGIPRAVPQRPAAEMRAVLGLPTDLSVRVIAQIGRFTEYKGQDVLLRAARTLLAAEPNLRFVLIGHDREGQYKASLALLAAELGVADKVVMTAYPGPIGDVWQLIDLHAHASLFDSLPISIAEGMSLGKPAVVTSAGGIPEIVEDGVTGLIVPPGDPEALAAGLLRLLRDPELAAQFGANARARYERNHKPAVMAQALGDCFMQMARKRRK